MEEKQETLGSYLAQNKECTALAVLWTTMTVMTLALWRCYGNWTLSSLDAVAFILCARILCLPASRLQIEKQQSTRWRRVHILVLIGIGVVMAFCTLTNTPFDLITWKLLGGMVGLLVNAFLPYIGDATHEGEKRREARDMSLVLAFVLLATAAFFAVVRPLTIRQGKMLAKQNIGADVTYIGCVAANDNGFQIYADGATDWEQKTGYYLMYYSNAKQDGNAVVYFATGRVEVR